MSIATGTKLGPYEITGAIGAGGMGEVYRAHDPKLGRDVAIKVLPEAFARDAERMARFQREAKVLASLNHPNIATIHGLEDSGTTQALVMELVEGPTLADRIKASPIPVDEAVRIAKQIADALEYAHERGIIHRDLKPANVKVTNDDAVKVLDFGLAKALEGDPSSIDISTSPTISRMATQAGVLLGTAAYMSPEQAKAKSVDRRADIWAFGCVLYEMLTGKVAFPGDSVTDTLAGVIRAEPDWSQLPSSTPMRVRVLLQRCLQKDPKQRLRDIGDARISLDEVLSGAPDPSLAGAAAIRVPLWRRALPWALLGVTAIALVTLGWVYFRLANTLPNAEVTRLQIPLPDKMSFAGGFELSPDGRQGAFVGIGSDGVQRIWVRPLDSLEARPLLGTESPGLIAPFFWSPDSRSIAFDAGGKLKKIAIAGGPTETICNLEQGMIAVGGSWNRDGVIIFGQSQGGLMRVSAGGGSASPLTIVDRSRGEYHHVLPLFLPDGRHFIYSRPGPNEIEGIYVGSLDTKPEQQNSTRLIAGHESGLGFVPSSDSASAYLLFERDRALMAQPFDARRLELSGEPVTLADNAGSFSASPNGVLAYQAANVQPYQLRWLDREGKALITAGEPGIFFYTVDLSPDGKRAAVSVMRAWTGATSIWLLDRSRGTSTQFTFDRFSIGAVWSPDGSRIIFSSNREGDLREFDLYQKPASGATDEELLLKSDERSTVPTSWSRDGRFLIYTATDSKMKKSIWVLPLQSDKKPLPFLRTEFNEDNGRLSPDGRWVAYQSDESGTTEVYVRPFSHESGEAVSGVGGKWLISNAGGSDPRWKGDGKELYYRAPDGKLMAVEVSTVPVFQAGVPRVLIQAPLIGALGITPTWDVTSDGKSFLFVTPAEQAAHAPFTVVLNWQAALKK